MGLAGLIATTAIMLRHEGSAPLGLLALIGGIHGIVFTIIGLWLRKMRQNLERLKSVQELAEEYGSTPEAVQRLAEAHSIRARININNENLYDPDEFVASRSLLRGASSPYGTEILLRAADSAANKTVPETLLRAAEPESTVALTPIQQLFFAPDEESEESKEATQYLRR